MKKLMVLLLICSSWICGLAQQTSTDTLWKEKMRAKGLPVPQYPVSLTVAQDGSGDYKTIQEAINGVRDLSQVKVIIYVRPGIYREKVIVPSWKTNIVLMGEKGAQTVITNSDYSGKENSGGKVAFGRAKFSTYTSYTLLVQGNDFSAENIRIENTAGRVGQAVALHVEADRVIIRNCRLIGNQDTLYTATENSRQYYESCYIEGTTDFIFGEATAVFQQCTIKSLTNSYITAAATREEQKYGYVFFNCELIADTGVSKAYLGRPWRPHARTVFINTKMGTHILPAGWDNWGNAENEKTTFYADYNSTGVLPGSRVSWAKKLTDSELKKYTLSNIFSGWVPSKGMD